jgi:hypothetical protein
MADQRLHFFSETLVASTDFIEVLGPLVLGAFQGCLEQPIDLCEAVRCHRAGLWLMARSSHALAALHSRITVTAETPNTSAV